MTVSTSRLAECIKGCFGLTRSNGLEWNWAGKSFCILTIAAFFIILPSEVRRKSGLLKLPSSDSALPVIGYWASCVVISLLGAFAPTYPLPFNTETLAYQALMPSLAEEPVFRGILPALLAMAMGSPWRIAGAQLGWWWLAISFYFLDWDTPAGGHHKVHFRLMRSHLLRSRSSRYPTVGSLLEVAQSGPVLLATA